MATSTVAIPPERGSGSSTSDHQRAQEVAAAGIVPVANRDPGILGLGLMMAHAGNPAAAAAAAMNGAGGLAAPTVPGGVTLAGMAAAAAGGGGILGGTGNGSVGGAPSAATTTTMVIPGETRSILTNRKGQRCDQCGRRPPCHHQTNPRRTAKIRHRSSTTSEKPTSSGSTAAGDHHPSSSISSANATATTPATANLNSHGSTTAAALIDGLKNSEDNGSATPFDFDMEQPVLSYWGTDPVPLPSRFARIKRDLVAGHEEALQASWARLIVALRSEVEHIENLGSHLIPSIEYAEVENPAQAARFERDLKRYGVGVVRGVVPREDADAAVRETARYVETKHGIKPPPPQDPTCFDFFWTPAQVRMRAHSHVLNAQRFMMSLWETYADDRVATRFPITYADRIRIHGTNITFNGVIDGTGNASQPETPNGVSASTSSAAPKSADDWLNAIQSSTIIAQVDNGSLERWEPDGYTRGGTYAHVFRGEWESYDPWECAGRITTTIDLYNGYGACSIFRMFQGIIALSTIEPGMVRLLPSPRLATAYFLLRPFFSPKSPPPEVRQGPEWEAFLSPENWALDREQSTIIHGAVPGHAQRITELWHPHLYLRRSLVTLPTLQAGDYIFWHPDLPYHITSDGSTGLRSLTSRPDDVSMLLYVPAAPLTQTNALYLARQRKAFLRGFPGPDFDSTGSGLGSEALQPGRLGEKEIAEMGGPAALQAMGLAPWEFAGTPSSGRSSGKDVGVGRSGGDGDVDMDGTGAGMAGGGAKSSAHTPTSTSHAEEEVVRLANIIVFPDRCMMGFPHDDTKRS
jgi:hypothetical protein